MSDEALALEIIEEKREELKELRATVEELQEEASQFEDPPENLVQRIEDIHDDVDEAEAKFDWLQSVLVQLEVSPDE